ncbi:MAG: hypothetical protein REJ23_03115 [Brevundimonas sp.]|nr:hypothetical protein [Brevundimonas sp.]
MSSQIAMWAALALQTPEPVALAVVPTDWVTHGESRYLETLLSSLERGGRLQRTPSTLDPERIHSCLDDSAPEPCLRRQSIATGQSAGESTALIVIGLSSGEVIDGEERDAVQVYCIRAGSGDVAGNRKPTALHPSADRMQSVQPFQRDLDALSACIEAARAE